MRKSPGMFRRMPVCLFFALLAGHGQMQAQKQHTLSGYVRDTSGEVLIGASVMTNDPYRGAVSNAYGFYSLTLPAGRYIIFYSYLGYETRTDTLDLDRSVVNDVYLSPANIMLSPVEMRAGHTGDFVHRTGMGKVELQMPVINQMPHLFGETDLFKSLQLLPGIQSAGEGNSGLVVRGGKTDQNLVLLDEATVYNPFHLMGFFSVFNRDAIHNVTVYKGDIPAQYGGRLSSLIDVRMKDGNLKRWEVSGGIGTISSRLNVEGPLIRDKGSVILSARRSYADIFLPLLKNEEIRNNRLYFYDLNGKANIRINDKNRVYYSIYKGKDAFMLSDVVLVTWGNITQSLRWNHLYSKKLFSNLTLAYNTYEYNLGKNAEFTGIRWESGLEGVSMKYDFSYYPGRGHTIRFGAQTVYHSFNPGYLTGITSESIYNNLQLPESAAVESAVYYGHEYTFTEKFAIEAGLRYSGFFGVGEATIYLFNEDYFPYDTLVYGRGDIYSPYGGMEPRIGLRYSPGEFSSVKLNYSRTRQYLHLASNSTSDSPLDVWLPSSPNIPPQYADHVAIGYFRSTRNKLLGYSLELYYKKMVNQVDFRDHARVFLNPLLEGEFRVGEGHAYGAEFFLRKQEGRLTGWLAYTLSRSVRKIEGVNQGRVYPADHSRTHDFSLVGQYSLSERISISSNWVFVSGLPVTYPSGRFEYWNTIIPVYTERNANRMPSYHRLDISMTLKNRVKPGRRYRDEWVFSVYNAYYRKNAWLIYFVQSEENPDETEARKLYMFPVIPSVSYHFRF